MSNNEPKGIPTWLIPTWLKVVVGIAIAVAVLLISLYFWKFSNGLAEKQDVWGQFGDYVGGILNPLFSLTALIALLYTIHLQSKELHESTQQLKASAEALTLQNNVMVRQQFETTFFQILRLFNEVVNSLEFSAQKEHYINRHVIGKLSDILKRNHLIYTDKNKIEPIGAKTLRNGRPYPPSTFDYDNATLPEAINVEYNLFYKQYGYLLSHYFLNLYSIIKFVDKSNLPDEDKKFYTNIVRAQLSEHELALLFYNCLCLDDAREKFLPLVQKYKLLKHLNNNLLADPTHRELLPF